MPRFRVDEFKLGHYHGPVHIADHTAGHDIIKTTTRYVHSQANAVRTLFARLAALRNGKLQERSGVAKSGDKNGYTRWQS